MLSEKSAWLYLAESWSKPTFTGAGTPSVLHVIDKHVFYDRGICSCIYSLVALDKIDDKIERSMLNKLFHYCRENKIEHAYYWPLTVEGAASRAEFCRKQAELL